MRSSIPLFNALATDYDGHFAALHRRAYDDLAWEFVESILPCSPGHVIDAGCGTGRWAERLIELGHQVIGIEQAPAMALAARFRIPNARFHLVEASMEHADLPEGHADITLAMGSLQYTLNPEEMIRRLGVWTRPGGWVVVLVDSLAALVLELTALGRFDEALNRLHTRMGTWVASGQTADNHQLDRDRLVSAFHGAGLSGVRAHGLLVGASLFGRKGLYSRLRKDWEKQMNLERELTKSNTMADLGKQILVIGQRGSLLVS